MKDAGIHFICVVLTVVDVCPICRKGIETAIKLSANVANQSLRQQQNATTTDGPGEASEVPREVTDDDDEALTSTVDGNVEQVVQNLTLQIMALAVASPLARPFSSGRGNVVSTPLPSIQRRPPHCLTCGHLKQDYQRPVAQGTLSKSPVCPSQSCTREGRVLDNVIHCMSSLTQGRIFRETHIHPDLTEWLHSFSQSTVTPGQIGSNTCTIISVYGAILVAPYTEMMVQVKFSPAFH